MCYKIVTTSGYVIMTSHYSVSMLSGFWGKILVFCDGVEKAILVKASPFVLFKFQPL